MLTSMDARTILQSLEEFRSQFEVKARSNLEPLISQTQGRGHFNSPVGGILAGQHSLLLAVELS